MATGVGVGVGVVGVGVNVSTSSSTGEIYDIKIQEIATSAIAVLDNVNPSSKKTLERQLKALDASECLSFLEAWSDKIAAVGNPLELCESLAALLDCDQVEKAVEELLFTEDSGGVHSHIRELIKSKKGTAEFFITHTETFSKSINFEHMLEKVWVLCNNIIIALGMNDLLDLNEGQYDASYKVQKLMMVAQAYSLFLQLAIELAGYRTGLIVTCSLLVLIMILSVSPRLVSVPPHKLLNEIENLTLMAQRGELKKYEGRCKEKKAIAQALASGKHVLLTGKAGVGKTKIIRGGFVFDVLDDKFSDLPKNTRLFYGNGADILAATSWNSDDLPLQRIKKNMESQEDRVVLVIDELHVLFEPQLGAPSSMGSSLLTKLDEGGFGRVIGITTDDGYRKMEMTGAQTELTKSRLEDGGGMGASSDVPVLRRFERIPIESASPEEMDVMLQNVICRERPFTICEPGAMSYLAEKTKATYGRNSKEPAQSMAVLRTMLQRLSCLTPSGLANTLEAKRQELLSLDARALNDLTRNPQQELSNDNTALRATKLELQKECNELEDQLKKQQKKAKLLSKRSEQYYRVRKRYHEAVLKISNTQNKQENTKSELKIFLLVHYFVMTKMYEDIYQEATSNGLEVVLTKELIDNVIFGVKSSVTSPQ